MGYPTPNELVGAVQGTILYIIVYFCLLTYQSFSKFYLYSQKKKEAAKKDNKKVSLAQVKYYNADVIALQGDRSVGNFVEQSIAFLPLFWLHAVFVDPSQSFTIALIYTISRAIYPIVFILPFGWLFVSTLPGYMVLSYLIYELNNK